MHGISTFAKAEWTGQFHANKWQRAKNIQNRHNHYVHSHTASWFLFPYSSRQKVRYQTLHTQLTTDSRLLVGLTCLTFACSESIVYMCGSECAAAATWNFVEFWLYSTEPKMLLGSIWYINVLRCIYHPQLCKIWLCSIIPSLKQWIELFIKTAPPCFCQLRGFNNTLKTCPMRVHDIISCGLRTFLNFQNNYHKRKWKFW